MITDNDLIKRFTSVIFTFSDSMGNFVFNQAELEQVIKTPEIKMEGSEFVISSMPSQLEIFINPARMRFVDKSDEMPVRSDYNKNVIQIAGILISANNKSCNGFGVNFDVEMKTLKDNLAREVILNRFINRESFASTGYDLNGASIRLWYTARDKRHTIHIEPRENAQTGESYFCHLNIHFDITETLPDEKQLEQIISEEYEDFKNVLSKSLIE